MSEKQPVPRSALLPKRNQTKKCPISSNKKKAALGKLRWPLKKRACTGRSNVSTPLFLHALLAVVESLLEVGWTVVQDMVGIIPQPIMATIRTRGERRNDPFTSCQNWHRCQEGTVVLCTYSTRYVATTSGDKSLSFRRTAIRVFVLSF